jgi:predicted membrane protein
MILIYGMFALATNIIASKTFQNCQVEAYHDCAPNVDFLVLSLGSKQENPSEENQRYYIIQAWLGVAMVIVWFVTFSILKYSETLKLIKLDRQTKSAADYTIVVEGIPNSFTQKDF